MKFFNRNSLLIVAVAFLSATGGYCAQTQEVENPYDYLSEGYTAAHAERFFNVNTDEMGPAVFMIAQGSFWTVKDVQNALLSLEVMSDKRQVNKVFNDLKKFIAQGPEKHLEESLLKNTIAATLKGLGQQGHALSDFPDWRVCVDGIAPAFTQEDVIAWVKEFIDPWVVAPKSKKIILSNQLPADQRSAAISLRKKFEEIPFPFLYRLKETTARAGFPFKKMVWYFALVYGALKVKGSCSARLADYTATVKDMPTTECIQEISKKNRHLVGPAVALYCVDLLQVAVASEGILTLDVKKPGNKDCNVSGAYWTFEQFAAYKKLLFASPEKLENLYTNLFGHGQHSVELMKYRIDCVLKLLVPSVEYNPFDASAKCAALFNKDRKHRHASDNGKELKWLYRWAWFYARTETDLAVECDQSLLGADLSADGIPKKLYAEVEKLIQGSMRELNVVPTPFKDVKNTDALQARSVVFRDPRKVASAELLKLLELYHDDSNGKSARLWTQNLYHQMPFWNVLYNTATGAGNCSPCIFDGTTIKPQNASHLDHFVIAARVQRCYPYAYFGFSPFRKKSEGGAAEGSSDVPAGATTRGVPPRRAVIAGASTCAIPVDASYRTSPEHKVCDILAFSSAQNEAVWDRNYDGSKHKAVIQVNPDGKITFVGAPFTTISTAPAAPTDDIFIFQSGKCSAEQKKIFEDRLTYLRNNYCWHPGSFVYPSFSCSQQEAPELWLSLKKIARETGCQIEMCTTYDQSNWEQQYSVYLCCSRPADAQNVRAYLKDSGLIPASVPATT